MTELPRIESAPRITPEQLIAFYVRNKICEASYGAEKAARILHHPHIVVAAFGGEDLVGLARATFDGLAACIMEVSIDLRWLGLNRHENGSLIESDPHGLGKSLGQRLLHDIRALGGEFVTVYPVESVEEVFYAGLGFSRNEGHVAFYIDERPYVAGES